MAEPMSQLTIRLLGTPVVTRDGVPWSLANRKAQALCYYLATTGQSFTRDHLAALLWGEATVHSARHSLRSCLYRVRQGLGALKLPDLLLVDGELVRLDMTSVDCDAARILLLGSDANEQADREAVELYRGPFLQGFSLADATLFDEWMRQEDAKITRTYLAALDRLASTAERQSAWEPAIALVQRIIQVDPLAEEAQQRLMALYVRSGAPGLARQHYQRFELTLQRELGLAPTAQTQQLLSDTLTYQRIGQRSANPPAHFVRPKLDSLPLVGRDALLAQLHALGEQVATGRGTTVVLQGEAGIGKSRLVDELISTLPAETAGGQAWIVLSARCSPFDDHLAYQPFREALRGLPLDTLQPLQNQLALPDSYEQLAERVLKLLQIIGRSAPILLAIDDLHFADSATLNLFGFLALHSQKLPLLLIGTVQRADRVPALQQLVTLGRRHGELALLAVPALTLEAVTALLAATGVARTAIESLAPWLYEGSAGNPFVVEEMIAQLRADALLVAVDGGWHLDIRRWISWRATFALPETTYDLVSLRLSALPPAARRILDALAVAGERLPLALLVAVLQAKRGSVRILLEELIAQQLVAEWPDDLLALSQPLLRATILEQMSSLARHALHRQLAEAWERSVVAGSGGAEQLARHAVAGGDIERARRWALRQLSDLPYHYAGIETIAFLRELYDLLAPTASPQELRRLTHALGQGYHALGQLDLAAGWHQRHLALTQADQATDDEAIAHFELAELAFVTNNYQAASASARAGMELATSAPATLHGRGQRLLGAALALEGSDLPDAELRLQAAIIIHRDAGDHANLCAALFELGNVVAQQGAIVRAIELYRAAADAAVAGHTPFLLALAYNNIAYHSLLLGQLENARRAAANGRAVADTHELTGAFLHLYSTESEIHLYVGDWAAATVACRHGLALAEELGSIERRAGYQAGLARAAYGQQQPDSAIRLLEAALATIAGHGYWHLRTRILLWLAEILDDPTSAGAHLDAALTLARTQNREILLLQGERLQAGLLAAQGDTATAQARLVELLDRAAGRGLTLEVARTQAALAQVSLQQAPNSAAGRAMLAEALRSLLTLGAHAEHTALLALSNTLKLPRR